MQEENPQNTELLKVIQKLIGVVVVLLVALILMPIVFYNSEAITAFFKSKPKKEKVVVVAANNKPEVQLWIAPDPDAIDDPMLKEMVLYGKDLIAHTSKFFGPNGSISHSTNGLNCQNCHLDAGTRAWGNNYGSVASMYPKFRARSGAVEDIYKRVNDCFERSLNGQPLDTLSKEMQAIKSYMVYLGSNVEKGKKADGSGFKELGFMARSADPELGKELYATKCASCHKADGQGQLMADGSEYTYPPLWGQHSYNDGAGLYRITNFAKYIKYNMPLGATHENPQLSDEEAWDIAAFVNSQSRPHKSVPQDWPDVSKKPVDHPFGPYADGFDEKQHKFGPWGPIEEARQAKK